MANTTRATKTEMAICYQFNSVIKKMNHATAMNKGKLTSFYKFEGLLDDGKEIVERLVRDIPEIINEVSAEHHGSANSEVTFAWSKYGAGKKAISRTPKTDICIGEKYTTSLKMGDSQLMSGHTEEATATLHAALDEFPEVYDIPEVETCFNLIQKFERGICFGTCAELIKYGGDPAITRVNNIHKDLMKTLDRLFTLYPKVKKAFIKEAMTGEKKFGKDSRSSAKYILQGENFDNSISFHSVDDDVYLTKVVDATKISVKFKSNSRDTLDSMPDERVWWSALGLVTKKI